MKVGLEYMATIALLRGSPPSRENVYFSPAAERITLQLLKNQRISLMYSMCSTPRLHALPSVHGCSYLHRNLGTG